MPVLQSKNCNPKQTSDDRDNEKILSVCSEKLRFFGRYILSILLLGGCQPNSENTVRLTDYGLIESTNGRSDIEQAIAKVNDVIGHTGLRTLWTPNRTRGVIVAIVEPEGLPYNTVAQCSPDKKVIFVSSNWKEQCKATFEWLLSKQSSATIPTLAVILLHEMGHIEKLPANVHLSPMPKMDNLTGNMKIELAADEYAAYEMKSSASKAAQEMKSQVAILEVTIREKIMGRGFFAGQRYQGLYEDDNNTHPNLLLRFSIMDHYLNPIDSNSVLTELLEMRNNK